VYFFFFFFYLISTYINNIEFLYFSKKEEKSKLLKACNVSHSLLSACLRALSRKRKGERLKKNRRIIVFPTIDDYRKRERERKQSIFLFVYVSVYFLKLILQATYTYTWSICADKHIIFYKDFILFFTHTINYIYFYYFFYIAIHKNIISI